MIGEIVGSFYLDLGKNLLSIVNNHDVIHSGVSSPRSGAGVPKDHHFGDFGVIVLLEYVWK